MKITTYRKILLDTNELVKMLRVKGTITNIEVDGVEILITIKED